MLTSKYKIPILRSINTNEAVALGAAYYAYSLQHSDAAKFVIHDILNALIGIEGVKNGNHIFIPIINKYSPLPFVCLKRFPSERNSKTVVIRVYEGENLDLSKNTELGEFTID